jgi:hypothetical protein
VSVACFIGTKLCEGLDYAHRKKDAGGNPLGIVHRDVSPQNVLVAFEGEVKLIDFGIAKARYRSSKTAAGVLKGKFGYMSPEQVRGLVLDRRSDIFAVGTLLYEMCAGIRLFVGESDFTTLEKVRNVDVSPPSRHNPAIPAEIDRIIMKALARAPEDRYQWANELQEDLQSFLLSQKPLTTTKRLAAWMKEHFAEDIQRERQEHERYLKIHVPGAPAGGEGGPARALADFDAYDDEETNLMKKEQGRSDFEDIETLASGSSRDAPAGPAMAGESTRILDPDDAGAGGGIHGEATVIFWSGAGDGSEPEAPPEGATMILADGEAPPEGATMILGDGDDVVDGVALDHAVRMGRAAAAPAPAPAAILPGDLPPPPVSEDPFGLEIQRPSIRRAEPSIRTGTRTAAPAPRQGPLRLVVAALVGAVLAGGLVGVLMRLTEPRQAPRAPRQGTAALVVRLDADVEFELDGKTKGRTGPGGAALLRSLAPGDHQIEVRADGHHPARVAFRVEAGDVTLVGPIIPRRLPQPSTLAVQLSEAFRDAEVTLDRQRIPAARLGQPIPLPLDRKIELRVTMLGYDDFVYTVEAGHDQKHNTPLISLNESEKGQMAVQSRPEGAEVFVNDQKQPCVTPCRVVGLELDRKHRVRVQLGGHSTYEKDYPFPRDQKVLTVDANLSPGKG